MQTYTTPESQSARRSQKVTSKFSAVLLTGVLHAAAVGAFAFWYIAGPRTPQPSLIVSAPRSEPVERPQPKTFSSMIKDTPSSSSSQMTKLITARAPAAPVTLPETPEITLDTLDVGVGFGDGTGFGSGLGSGSGIGGGPPRGSPLANRCSARDRQRHLASGGGNKETEAAVVAGLKWLKSKQAKDGSWGEGHKAAMTGLALLAYLGHCETHESVEFGETVTKAIYFLVEKALNNDGALRQGGGHPWVYEHGIATYALCEAYSLVRYGKRRFRHLKQLKQAIALAVPIIIEGQNGDGGWVYAYEGSDWHRRTQGKTGGNGGPGDTSITGWHMQALKAATLTDLEFRGINGTIRKGVKFLQGVQGPSGGFGYRGPGDKFSLAGVGALAQQMFRTGSQSSVRRAVDFILDHDVKIGAKDASIYGWYYGAQACFQEGGHRWKKWNTMFRDQAVAHQSKDGSWPSEGGSGGDSSQAAGSVGDAQVYRTSLFILMLEVYYRYLPATK